MNPCYRLCLLMVAVMAFVGCKYEDGPAISLRSKDKRIRFNRPMTYYTVDGADSLQWLLNLYQDSIPAYSGLFDFHYEPDEECQWITGGESGLDVIGAWCDGGHLKTMRILLPYLPFDMSYGEVLRLSNREFWLRAEGGGKIRELRFEE